MARDKNAWPLAAGAAFALLYLAAPSSFYNFDGVACAIAVELGDYPHLAHGNHLAYGLIARLFYRLWTLFGYRGQAIVSLQALASLSGGVGIALFCRMALAVGFKPRSALLAGAGLGLSYAWWFWSLEAQVNMLAAVGLLLAAGEALREKPRPVRLGLLHAGAVLGHVAHLCFLPAAVFLLWTSIKDARARRSRLVAYLAALSCAVLAAYAAAGIMVIRPGGWSGLRAWLLGSAALGTDLSFQWHGGYSWDGLKTWGLMSLRAVSPTTLLAALAMAAALVGAGTRGSSLTRRQAAGLGLWLTGYAVLFASWEPFTMVYRVTDLVPLWMFIARAVDARPRWAPAAAAWVALAGGANWLFAVKPQTSAQNNAAYQDAAWLASETPDNAWIMARGFDEVYVPYFAHRRPLILRYYPTERHEALRARLREIRARGERVFATSRCLESPELKPFLEGYRLVAVAARGKDRILEITETGSRRAKDKRN